jgi:hypothetical protein
VPVLGQEALAVSAVPEVRAIHGVRAISDPMRELIEDLWPELVYKLPPKKWH